MVKDGHKPKGRTSAYAFFVMSCREELKKKSQTAPVNFSEFSKSCSEQWKALSAAERKKYEDMTKADKARYEEEMKKYTTPKDVVKSTNKPKGRTSAFAFFVLSCREELKRKSPNAPVNYSQLFMSCFERWKALGASEKSRFEEMEFSDKVRYEEELKSYTPPKGTGKKERKKKDPNTPRRPLSAFFIFCSENRPLVKSEYPKLTISEIAKKLVEMWCKMSSDERLPFEKKAALLRGKYERGATACPSGAESAGKGPSRPAGSSRVTKDEEDKEDEDDMEEDDDDDEEDEDDDEDEDEEYEYKIHEEQVNNEDL
ncbi:high mobility group protein B2-like isoform X2 [Hoplias malabaricus]